MLLKIFVDLLIIIDKFLIPLFFTLQGITCNDIFEQTKWKLDSREVVLSAIRAIQPQFQPKVKMAEAEYNCALVNHLNSDPVSYFVIVIYYCHCHGEPLEHVLYSS